MWHGYVLLEKTANLNQANFDTLRNAFRAVTPTTTVLPAFIMHTRVRLDSGAEIFECAFNPADVEVNSFKAFMAALFGVDPVNVGDYIIGDVSYSGNGRETRTWGFTYPIGGNERLQVKRFGRGADWPDSRRECVAFLIANAVAWGEEVEV